MDAKTEQIIVDAPLSAKMKAMIGFRNIAAHDYQEFVIMKKNT